LSTPPPPRTTLFPYTTLFRSRLMQGKFEGEKSKLAPREIARYSRQIQLAEVGLEGQRKLKASRVLMIGAGGLGSPAGLYLTAAGDRKSTRLNSSHVKISYAVF